MVKITSNLTVTLANTSNAFPDDDVTAQKHVGPVLMSMLI